ncbi:unnamed protein product [Choristocarpus tenellus]
MSCTGCFGFLFRFLHKYKIELNICGMVFFLTGAKVPLTVFMTQYVHDMSTLSSKNAHLLLTVLWASLAVGRFLGMLDLRDLSLRSLYQHSTLLHGGGAISMLVVLLFPSSNTVLWICVAAFGLCNGPSPSYCFDLNNKITLNTSEGTSVIILGLNSGVSFMPFVVSALWQTTGSPLSLIIVLVVCHIAPYLFMMNVRRMHEKIRYRECTTAAAVTTTTLP